MKLILALVCLYKLVAADYDVQLSKKLSGYGLVTYCKQQSLEAWSCPLCKQLQAPSGIQYFQNNIAKIAGYAGYLKSIDNIIVVFRGTYDDINWLEDASFKQVSYSACANCLIHEGFYLSYLSIAPYMLNAVQKLKKQHPDSAITVAGCSLGGAIATIAAIELQLKYNIVERLDTVGSPRVANLNLAKYIYTKIPRSYRVVHSHDIVPHLPLISQNYHHLPQQVFFDQHMTNYVICDENGEDNSCSNKYYPNYNALDHLTYWYEFNLPKYCGK